MKKTVKLSVTLHVYINNLVFNSLNRLRNLNYIRLKATFDNNNNNNNKS